MVSHKRMAEGTRKQMNTLFLIAGESGSGKDTVVDYLCRMHDCTKIRSLTSRPKRADDKPDTHWFVTREEIESIPHKIGYTEFAGHLYCATQTQAEHSDFYIIDKAGIDYFKEHYKGQKPYRIIYIKTYPETRMYRMIVREKERGVDGKTAARHAAERLVHDIQAFREIEYISDCIVENEGTVAECADKIWMYMNECEKEAVKKEIPRLMD